VEESLLALDSGEGPPLRKGKEVSKVGPVAS